MFLTQVPAFFQGFNFDTLLALISCVTGVIALFVGGTAYHNCQTIKKAFNDKKEFHDNSSDHSQKAGRDLIINHNGSDANLLMALTKDNFKEALDQAYAFFEKKTDDNLHKIIDESSKIVRENQINLGAYTKVDWINVYFENAKNASDSYMQNVWAKILTKELAAPGSFSYQTLEIVRRMSADDFKLFEKMCSLVVDRMILQGTLFTTYGLVWLNILRLGELGLINVNASARTVKILPNGDSGSIYQNQYLILLKNSKGSEIDFNLAGYLLTSSAMELIEIATVQMNQQYAIDYAKEIEKLKPDGTVVSIHKINYISDGNINYEDENMLEHIEGALPNG